MRMYSIRKFDRAAHHALAAELEKECAVLLQNKGALPLARAAKIAYIGGFAEKPRYQGGGSSHITVSEELSALEAVRSVCPVTYAPAFSLEEDVVDEALQAEAVEAAKAADVAALGSGAEALFRREAGYTDLYTLAYTDLAQAVPGSDWRLTPMMK